MTISDRSPDRLGTSASVLVTILLSAFVAHAVEAQPPRRSYAIHLEATPVAAFPFLDKLGRIEIEVYPEGVRADSPWLSGFVRGGSDSVRIENHTLRLYTDSTFAGLRELIDKLRPKDQEPVQLGKLEIVATGKKGTIGKLPVARYRVILGKEAWIDVWSTTALAESEAYDRLQSELLRSVSPELAAAARRIPGTILHVVVNTESVPEKTVLRTRRIYLSSAGQDEALTTGRFFLRAPSLDKLAR